MSHKVVIFNMSKENRKKVFLQNKKLKPVKDQKGETTHTVAEECGVGHVTVGNSKRVRSET